MHSVYDFSAKAIDGNEKPLSDYNGQVLLIVNTASRCGYTPQYEGLEALHRKFHARGFSVLGFPCNQFGGQEPGHESDIAEFCVKNYGVSFPMFAKVDVNGPNAHPLFVFLKDAKAGILGLKSIKWNFSKFLVGRDGQVVDRLGSAAKPADLAEPIARLL